LEPSFASAPMPAGIIYKSEIGRDMPLALPKDAMARLFSEYQTLPPPPLPPPPLPPPGVPHARHYITTLDMHIRSQVMLILQQRLQQRREENKRALGLLQLLGIGGDAGMALQSRNAANGALQQQALAVSLALSHGGYHDAVGSDQNIYMTRLR
jgi:hypothetical protein